MSIDLFHPSSQVEYELRFPPASWNQMRGTVQLSAKPASAKSIAEKVSEGNPPWGDAFTQVRTLTVDGTGEEKTIFDATPDYYAFTSTDTKGNLQFEIVPSEEGDKKKHETLPQLVRELTALTSRFADETSKAEDREREFAELWTAGGHVDTAGPKAVDTMQVLEGLAPWDEDSRIVKFCRPFDRHNLLSTREHVPAGTESHRLYLRAGVAKMPKSKLSKFVIDGTFKDGEAEWKMRSSSSAGPQYSSGWFESLLSPNPQDNGARCAAQSAVRAVTRLLKSSANASALSQPQQKILTAMSYCSKSGGSDKTQQHSDLLVQYIVTALKQWSQQSTWADQIEFHQDSTKSLPGIAPLILQDIAESDSIRPEAERLQQEIDTFLSDMANTATSLQSRLESLEGKRVHHLEEVFQDSAWRCEEHDLKGIDILQSCNAKLAEIVSTSSRPADGAKSHLPGEKMDKMDETE